MATAPPRLETSYPPPVLDPDLALATAGGGISRTGEAGRRRTQRARAAAAEVPPRTTPRPRSALPPRAPAARPPAPAPGTAAGYAPPKSAASTGGGGEWAFLDSKSTSIEDKLFAFMKKVTEKTDKELVDKMKEYKARFTAAGASGTTSPRKKGFSLFDGLKVAVPALGLAEKVFGEAGVQKALTSLGGPLLAAGVTAIGMPQLAPVALQYGGDVVQLAFKEVSGSPGSAAGGTAPKAEAGSTDEKLAMLELQVLVERQQRMFAAVSSTLKAIHDTQMVAVHNIR